MNETPIEFEERRGHAPKRLSPSARRMLEDAEAAFERAVLEGSWYRRSSSLRSGLLPLDAGGSMIGRAVRLARLAAAPRRWWCELMGHDWTVAGLEHLVACCARCGKVRPL